MEFVIVHADAIRSALDLTVIPLTDGHLQEVESITQLLLCLAPQQPRWRFVAPELSWGLQLSVVTCLQVCVHLLQPQQLQHRCEAVSRAEISLATTKAAGGGAGAGGGG